MSVANDSTKDAEKEEQELVYELHSMTTNPTTATTTSQQQQQHEHLCGDDQILKYIQTQSIVGIQDNYSLPSGGVG